MWYILKHLFTSVSVKVMDILYRAATLMNNRVIDYVFDFDDRFRSTCYALQIFEDKISSATRFIKLTDFVYFNRMNSRCYLPYFESNNKRHQKISNQSSKHRAILPNILSLPYSARLMKRPLVEENIDSWREN